MSGSLNFYRPDMSQRAGAKARKLERQGTTVRPKSDPIAYEESIAVNKWGTNKVDWSDDWSVVQEEGAGEVVWVDEYAPKNSEEDIKREEMMKRVTEMQADLKRRLMLGPYIFNELYLPHGTPRFQLPEVTQTSSLFMKILLPSPISDCILDMIMMCHDSGWKFAATCREAMRRVQRDITYFELTDGGYQYCDRSPSERHGYEPNIGRFLIISPRKRNRSDTSYATKIDGSPNYCTQINNVAKLCKAMYNFSDFIQHAQFHRVPFLTIEILALIIPRLRHLKHLAVLKCELIHVGETMKLLEIIQTDRLRGKENDVNLDFYPNFHAGPEIKPYNKYTVGSFGVTWDNWNGNSILAIWQLVTRIIPQAKSQDIDFISKGTSFRKWLDDGPCWRVEETLNAIQDPEYSIVQLAALLDSSNPHHHGSVKKFARRNKWQCAQGWEWSLEYYDCTCCKTKTLGILFDYETIRRHSLPSQETALRCLGCTLTVVLDNETDHYKANKRGIIQTWLEGPTRDPTPEEAALGYIPEPEINSNDLRKAISDFESKDMIRVTSRLDDTRQENHRLSRYDMETEEHQRPLTREETGTNYGGKNRSPEVWMKHTDDPEKDNVKPGEQRWNAIMGH